MTVMDVPAVPERSLQQRRDALVRANVIRTRRAQLKRDLKAGRVNVLDILEHPPEWALTMKVADLLLAVPKLGGVKVNKAFTRTRISHSKTIGGMTERQRGELLALLIWR